jgi:Na+/proline symporter
MERAIIGMSVLIGYSILVLLIGVWAYRHRKLSVEDYVTPMKNTYSTLVITSSFINISSPFISSASSL